jgi:adenylate cyclase
MENEIPTSNTTGQRTLAAVVFTDGVNFSTRMATNEDRTLELLRNDLRLMREICRCFSGRVLKSTGDGLLMCFISAVKAVECAVEIQRSLTVAANDLPPGDALQHRIGIHLGDVFISDTDVMGNGVNIAARLQAEAEPDGICISQTVYDVVRNSLRLETTYLGPRELKNIPEVVPAYRIRLPFLPQASDPYDEVTRNLIHHPNLIRIKKLIYYVCRNQWESEQFKLEELNLKDFVRELHRIAPTPEQLRGLLRDAIKTLSKQAEYLRVADTIAAEFSRLHYSQSESTQIVARATPIKPPFKPSPKIGQLDHIVAPPAPRSIAPEISEVVQELDQHQNAVRIKKLMFYTSRRQWENDATRLQQTDTATLIQELQTQHTTLESLQSALEERVKTLSKRDEYAQVAEVIVNRLSCLYANQLSDSPLLAPVEVQDLSQPLFELQEMGEDEQKRYDRLAQDLAQDSNAARIKKLMFSVSQNRWENDQSQIDSLEWSQLLQILRTQNPTLEHLQAALAAIVATLNKQAEYTLLANFVVEKMGELYGQTVPAPIPMTVPATDQTEIELAPSPVAASSVSSVAASTPDTTTKPELVDLRLQIMKYANPLRAKILLFSAMHHIFSYSQEDWLALRTHELEGLLQSLLVACKTFTDFDARLHQTARNFMEPEEMSQTIGAIVRAVRPFYLQASSPQAQSFVEYLEQNTQLLNEANTQIVHSSTGEDEDEHTCQLFSTSDLGRSTNSSIEATQQFLSAQTEIHTQAVSQPEENPASPINDNSAP